jgi:phage shock protein C
VEARKSFRLDRSNGKVLGVCAGLAGHFDIDVTLVRVASILVLAVTFPVALIGYFIVALVAGEKGSRRRDIRQPALTRGSGSSAEAARERLRELDLRMQAIESEIVGSRESALAREIDALR